MEILKLYDQFCLQQNQVGWQLAESKVGTHLWLELLKVTIKEIVQHQLTPEEIVNGKDILTTWADHEVKNNSIKID